MATKGYYNNPKEATVPNDTDLMGIQQGTTLADMKKIQVSNLLASERTRLDNLEAELGETTSASATQHTDVYELGNDADGADVIPLDGIVESISEGMTYRNEVENGDGSDGTTGWDAIGGAVAISGNYLQVTGDGTLYVVGTERTTPPVVIGDTYFVMALVQVDNSDCTRLAINKPYDYGVRVYDPVANTPYLIYGVVVADSTEPIRIISVYADALTANGKTLKIDLSYGISTINLTALGLDTLTASQCKERFRYVVDTAHVLPQKQGMTKKNWFDGELEPGSLDTAGQNVAGNAVRSKNYTIVKPNTEITLWNDNGYRNDIVATYGDNFEFIEFLTTGVTGDFTFTTGDNVKYIRFRSSADGTQTDLNTKYQLELGSVATTYEPFEGTTRYLPYISKRLPNDVRDSYEDGKFAKKVNDEHIVATSEIGYVVDLTNVTLARETSSSTTKTYADAKDDSDGASNGVYYSPDRFAVSAGSSTYYDTTDAIGGFLVNAYGVVTYILPLGTLLADAQTEIAGTRLYYQQAEPEKIDCQLPPLAGDEDGRFYSIPYIHTTYTVSSGLTITLDYEVSKIDSIVDEDKNDVSYSISGTTVTLTGVSEGDIVFVNAPIKTKLSAKPKTTNTYPQNVSGQIQYNTKAIKDLSGGVQDNADDLDVVEDAIQANEADITTLLTALAGGLTGQTLTKNSDADYDFTWV